MALSTRETVSTWILTRAALQGSSRPLQGLQRSQTAGKMPSNRAMVDSDVASLSAESGDGNS